MRILVVGASGHVGSAVAGTLEGRHEVIPASRSADISVDLLDPTSIERMFLRVGALDAVIVCSGSAPFKPLAELTREDYLQGFSSKVLGQLAVVHASIPRLADRGSITLTSGILGREPIATGAASSLVNGAIEAFVMAAATELPRGIRINVVSPTVLLEATSYHDTFPGFVPTPAAVVAQAYVKSVEGVQTGQVYAV